MREGIIFETLMRSKESKEIICIWTYNDDENCWSGYVKDFTDDLISLQHYTKYGKSDGILIIEISDVKSIDFNDDYSKALQCIIDYSTELDKQESINILLSENETWQFDTLKQIENKNKLIRIELNSDTYCSGFVERVSETDLNLNCIGQLGQDEGNVIYKIEDITSIRIDDIENRKRAILYRWRKASL